MTIDEAIKYADMLSCNVNAFEVSKQFGAMCADALRLAKKMSDSHSSIARMRGGRLSARK